MTVLLDCHMTRCMGLPVDRLVHTYLKGREKVWILLAGGMLRQLIEILRYSYVNTDIKRYRSGEPSLIGDAHSLPFQDASFDMVVSKDTLKHFIQPWTVVKEVHRLLFAMSCVLRQSVEECKASSVCLPFRLKMN